MNSAEVIIWFAGGLLNLAAVWCYLRRITREPEDLARPMHLLFAAGFGLWTAAALVSGDSRLAVLYGVLAVSFVLLFPGPAR